MKFDLYGLGFFLFLSFVDRVSHLLISGVLFFSFFLIKCFSALELHRKKYITFLKLETIS